MLISRYFFSLDILDVRYPDQDLHELKSIHEFSHTFTLFFRFLLIYVCWKFEMGTKDALGDVIVFNLSDLASFNEAFLGQVWRIAVLANSSHTEFFDQRKILRDVLERCFHVSRLLYKSIHSPIFHVLY